MVYVHFLLKAMQFLVKVLKFYLKKAKKIGFICRLVFYCKIKDVINTQRAKWNKTHTEKFERLKAEQQKYGNRKRRIFRNIIHNFSSYKLTPEEEHALLFSLADHIPVKQNDIKIKTEFESFTTTYLNIPTIQISENKMN